MCITKQTLNKIIVASHITFRGMASLSISTAKQKIKNANQGLSLSRKLNVERTWPYPCMLLLVSVWYIVRHQSRSLLLMMCWRLEYMHRQSLSVREQFVTVFQGIGIKKRYLILNNISFYTKKYGTSICFLPLFVKYM